jgi:hypothetical protein
MNLDSLIQDARFGLRLLIRRPAFTIVIVLVLALGVGANTAMFSIIEAVLLRSLPYRDSDRLVLVWQSSKEHRATGEWFNTYREFEEWQKHSRSFERLAALTWAVSEKTLVWRGKTQSVLAIPASVDFFSMLGVNANVGRTFELADLHQGCTAVLSHAFWQTELGAPTDVVGTSIPLDEKECRVIGIMPRDFSFYPRQSALWTLITPTSEFAKDPWGSVTGVFGRLKPGVSRAAAEAELSTLEQNIVAEAPKDLALPQAVPVVLNLQSEFTWLAGRNLHTALILLLAASLLRAAHCLRRCCEPSARTIGRPAAGAGYPRLTGRGALAHHSTATRREHLARLGGGAAGWFFCFRIAAALSREKSH